MSDVEIAFCKLFIVTVGLAFGLVGADAILQILKTSLPLSAFDPVVDMLSETRSQHQKTMTPTVAVSFGREILKTKHFITSGARPAVKTEG